MGVFAEIRNGFGCFCKRNIFVFQIWVNNSVVFWYSGMYVTKIIRINHDNVASRGAVGRTHINVRFQTGNRRKDHGTENFGGFVYVLDGFPQHVFVLQVFMCPTNITLFCLYFVSLFPGYHAEGYHAHPYHHGLSRLCIHPGHHTRAITLHHTRTSGYHTRY